MDPLAASTFREIIRGSTVGENGSSGPEITHVSTHSRRVRRGSAFFAIDGQRARGHSFAGEALENGAAAIVTSIGGASSELADQGHVIEVEDALEALQRLAAWWRRQIAGQIVAVVGSNGKTITKDALAHLLSGTRRVYASPGSYNSKLGVPLALLDCPRECDVAIFELAFNAVGEMATLEQIVAPDHVVMTNLGARWRSRFDDRDHQAREMLASCANLSADGWLLLGERDERIAAIAAGTSPGRLLTRGEIGTLPAFVESRYANDGLVVDASFPDGTSGTLSVRTPSEEILADIELAMGAAWLLGADASSLRAAANDYKPTSTRMEIWRSPSGVTLIRDVATPDPIAVGAGIRAAKRIAGTQGRTVVVLADSLELVDERAVEQLAQVLSAERVDEVYAPAGPLPDALRVATQALENPVPVQLLASTEELRSKLLEKLGVGDVALVQSPRSTQIEDLSTQLIGSMAPTRLYLDLSAIEENLSTFRRLVGPSVRVMAMVKALAYGTDSLNVPACLEASGIDFLGVSNADEGTALRHFGIACPILVMLSTGRDLDAMLEHRLTPVVYSQEMLEAVSSIEPPNGQRLSVHVKIDSGMHRTGFSPQQARDVLTRLRDSEHVRVEGIMTHFACADDPAEDGFTHAQLAAFQSVLDMARELGLHNLIRHAAATAATMRLPETHFDMVRIGIGLYGMQPSEATRAHADLQPAFGLVSRIVEVLDLEEGDRIGYGGTYRVPAGGARAGVVPAGYNDGVPRNFSNVGHVIVAGARCPILGTVSMDSMTVDLSGCRDARVGSDVLILGRYGDWEVAPEALAESVGTISYELMVRVGHRVQRIFTRH
jgi:Alr-MurF fusion protein